MALEEPSGLVYITNHRRVLGEALQQSRCRHLEALLVIGVRDTLRQKYPELECGKALDVLDPRSFVSDVEELVQEHLAVYTVLEETLAGD